MKHPRTRISDHAALRYLERVLGVDIEALRDELARRLDQAAAVGASGVIVDGFRYVLADGVLVTVEPVKSEAPKPRRVRPCDGHDPEDGDGVPERFCRVGGCGSPLWSGNRSGLCQIHDGRK